jgi:hypothetical protein
MPHTVAYSAPAAMRGDRLLHPECTVQLPASRAALSTRECTVQLPASRAAPALPGAASPAPLMPHTQLPAITWLHAASAGPSACLQARAERCCRAGATAAGPPSRALLTSDGSSHGCHPLGMHASHPQDMHHGSRLLHAQATIWLRQAGCTCREQGPPPPTYSCASEAIHLLGALVQLKGGHRRDHGAHDGVAAGGQGAWGLRVEAAQEWGQRASGGQGAWGLRVEAAQE